MFNQLKSTTEMSKFAANFPLSLDLGRAGLILILIGGKGLVCGLGLRGVGWCKRNKYPDIRFLGAGISVVLYCA